MIKINPEKVEESIPLWKGKLDYPITGNEIIEQILKIDKVSNIQR